MREQKLQGKWCFSHTYPAICRTGNEQGGVQGLREPPGKGSQSPGIPKDQEEALEQSTREKVKAVKRHQWEIQTYHYKI